MQFFIALLCYTNVSGKCNPWLYDQGFSWAFLAINWTSIPRGDRLFYAGPLNAFILHLLITIA